MKRVRVTKLGEKPLIMAAEMNRSLRRNGAAHPQRTEEKEDDGRKVTRLETDILFLKHACSILRQSSNTCMWFMEDPSQSSVGQTAQSRICSVTEKPHIGHRVG